MHLFYLRQMYLYNNLVKPGVVELAGVPIDLTKVTVDVSGCGYTVDELQKELFDRFNIQIEKSTFNTITLLLTIGTTRSKVSRLYDALMRLAREKGIFPAGFSWSAPYESELNRQLESAIDQAQQKLAVEQWRGNAEDRGHASRLCLSRLRAGTCPRSTDETPRPPARAGDSGSRPACVARFRNEA